MLEVYNGVRDKSMLTASRFSIAFRLNYFTIDTSLNGNLIYSLGATVA